MRRLSEENQKSNKVDRARITARKEVTEFGMVLPVIWDRDGSINTLEWETFCKGYIRGNKVKKAIPTAFSRNLAVITGGKDIG